MSKYTLEPSNEMQTREWFAAHLDQFEYDIIESRQAFPDYLLRDSSGNDIRVEAEHQSSNFVAHGHDFDGCDLVICWIHTQQLPLPVLELSEGVLHEPNALPTHPREYPVRVKTKRKTVPGMEEALYSAYDELVVFGKAFSRDTRAWGDCLDIMAEPRLELWSATRKLVQALKEKGVDFDGLHPYDLQALLFAYLKDRLSI